MHRSRHALNGDTIREMHLAFRRGVFLNSRGRILSVTSTTCAGRPSALWGGLALGRKGTPKRRAIDKVMKTQPAMFLKLLVLLVPREMQVEHRGGVKAMSDDQLEAAIEAITAMLAARDQSAAPALMPRSSRARRCRRFLLPQSPSPTASGSGH